MGAPSRSLPLVALALGVAILVLQIRVIAGGQTWDDIRYHTEIAPPRLAAAVAVQRGTLPSWWDGAGLGVPLAGEPAHGALYPPGWIAATPRALDLTLIAHLAWAALGVAVWARRRTTDPAALVAGVLAATTGLVTSAALRGALPALAHLPWLAAAATWLADADTRRDRSRAAGAIAAVLGLIALAGELAVILDALALCLALGASRRTARWLVPALAAGLAIGAVQWIPALLQLPRGSPTHVAGLPFARLIELLVPSAFGATAPDRAIPALAGAAPWAPSLFVGAPLLALAAVRAPPRRLLGVLATLAAAALLAGRGGWPSYLGAPELHLAALVLVLAAGSASGLDALAFGRRRAVLALGFGAALTALALGALAVFGVQHPAVAPAIHRALVNGALGTTCALAAAALAWRSPGRWLPLLCGLVVAPGVGAADSVAPAMDRSVLAQPAWAQLAARLPPPIRMYRPVFLPDHDLEDAIATFAGTSASRWGIAAARSDDPARAPVDDRAWLAAAHEGGTLLDRNGVTLAILPATVIGGRKLHALGRRGSWALVELPVAPPASVMHGWRWALDPDDALALLFPNGGGTGLLRGTTVLAGAGPEGPSAPAPIPCAIHSWHDGDIALSCATDAPGYAVISSSPAPGWRVTLDDHPTDWLTADVLRRAVAIPAGDHRIHWTYAAPGLPTGTLLCLAGVLGALALLGLGRRWKSWASENGDRERRARRRARTATEKMSAK
ncbi:MAG TPA: hypothetical protein VGD37_41405 [Kofleriaceae bacterium]